jgi:hypothetical protein
MFFFSYLLCFTTCTFLALAIIAENSFWLSNLKFPANLQQAAKHYIKSTVARNVSTQILVAFGNKSSALFDIVQSATESQYATEIATPLTDIVLDNLLCMLASFICQWSWWTELKFSAHNSQLPKKKNKWMAKLTKYLEGSK